MFDTFFDREIDLSVKEVSEIPRQDCEEFILGIHYAKRWPTISYSYGLFVGNELCGVVTYGGGLTANVAEGIAGKKYSPLVVELNRLCLKYNRKNEASFLVSRSLKLLPKNKIVVSYADTSQNHIGYVYQATNFLYCGLTAKRTDWGVKGKENLHNRTLVDEFRGAKDRSKAMKEKYGDDFYLKDRPRKHRYLYFVGTKKFKKEVRKDLKYKVLPYPKGLNHE